MIGEEIVFVHQVKQWQDVKVGFNDTHVRFNLRKFPIAVKEGESVDQVSQSCFLQFEIPEDHEIIEKFESDDYKGVKLRVKGLKGKKKDDFNMS